MTVRRTATFFAIAALGLVAGLIAGRWNRVERAGLGSASLTSSRLVDVAYVDPTARSAANANDAVAIDRRGGDVEPDDSPKRVAADDTAADATTPRGALAAAICSALEGGALVNHLDRDDKLRTLAFKLRGTALTHVSDGRGEITDPAVVAGILAESLERQGIPLSESQRESIADLVSSYAGEWERLAASYTDGTPYIEKVVDEVDLKRDILDSVVDALDENQRRIVKQLAADGYALPKLLSPLALTDARPVDLPVDGANEYLLHRAKRLTDKFGISLDAAERISALMLERYTEIADMSREFSELDRAILAGRAQVELYRALIETEMLDAAAQTKLLSSRGWVIPRRPSADD